LSQTEKDIGFSFMLLINAFEESLLQPGNSDAGGTLPTICGDLEKEDWFRIEKYHCCPKYPRVHPESQLLN
jgi:hypothetical protein